MKIIGPDALVFGVDDVGACTRYLTDYGLTPVGVDAAGGRFEALDGTCVVVKHRDDATLPPSLGTANMLRKPVLWLQKPFRFIATCHWSSARNFSKKSQSRFFRWAIP